MISVDPKYFEEQLLAIATKERERIIKLIEDNLEFSPYPSLNNRLLTTEALVALIEGESK